MPAPRSVFTFFVMFRGSAMGLCREFVLLSRFPVCVAHLGSSSPSQVHDAHQTSFGSEYLRNRGGECGSRRNTTDVAWSPDPITLPADHFAARPFSDLPVLFQS